MTARGIAHYAKLPQRLFAGFIESAVRTFCPIRGVVSNQPLRPINNIPAESTVENFAVGGGEGGKYNVLIFSHGLVGGLSAYCQTCIDFIREHRTGGNGRENGKWIVVAVEHGDGSAIAAMVGGKKLFMKKASDTEIKEKFGEGNGWKWRNSQVKQRGWEVEQIVNWLHDVNSGKVGMDGIGVGKGKLGERSEENGNPESDRFLKGKLNLENGVFMAGHSFGGATSLHHGLYQEQCSGMILMDPWLWPMGEDAMRDQFRGNNTKRILVIMNELSGMEGSVKWIKILKGHNNEKVDLDIVTIKNANHHVQSDYAFVFGSKLTKWIGLAPDAKYEARKYNSVNNVLCSKFLDEEVWKEFKEQVERGEVFEHDINFH